MEKFQHKLRTTIHTRSVEQIMTRSQVSAQQSSRYKLTQLNNDNITTFLRKFEIDRQNLNLAKRIMQCESQHSRNKYVKEWKKVKKFMRVRSNFKPQLSAQEPKIYKFQEMPGHGRLMIKVVLQSFQSHMKQLNTQSLYLLKFNMGGTQLIPNKEFLVLESAEGYVCQFMAPVFLKGRSVTVKLIKVVQNSLFQVGKFAINFSQQKVQQSEIFSKTGKKIGQVCFKIDTEVIQKQKKRTQTVEDNKQNFQQNRHQQKLMGVKSV